jgi:hypothetical protein
MLSLQPLPLKPSNQDSCNSNKTRKNDESKVNDGKCVKGEGTKMRDGSEAATSAASSQDVSECLKGKKSRHSTKLKDEKQADDTDKKKNERKSNSGVKSKTRDNKLVKRAGNDADISDEKMEKLKRTLRARKEVLNMYKDMSHSSDEADTSNPDTRVTCDRKQSANSRITSDGDHRRRSATGVSLTGQQKTLAKTAQNSRKSAKAKTNKRGNSCNTASSVKEEEKSDSDSDQLCKFETAESADSDSETDFKPKKVTKKRKSSDGKLLHGAVLASDAGTRGDGEDAQNKKKKNRCDVWTEVFLEEEEKWISVDVQRGKVHCTAELHVSFSFSLFTEYVYRSMWYEMYVYCVHILCTYTVYVYCVHILCTYTMYIYCVCILCTYTMYVYCVCILCMYTVYVYCVCILCTYTM